MLSETHDMKKLNEISLKHNTFLVHVFKYRDVDQIELNKHFVKLSDSFRVNNFLNLCVSVKNIEQQLN